MKVSLVAAALAAAALPFLASVTDALGNTVTTEYDAQNRPLRVTNPDGTFTETVYDGTSEGLMTSNGFQLTRQQAPSRRRARVFRALGGVIFGGHPKTPYLFDRTLAFSLNWHCRTHPDTF